MVAVVVPIAGASSRFRTFTTVPKWALKLGGLPILRWAIDSFQSPNLDVDRLLFVVRRDDYSYLQSILEDVNWSAFEIEVVDSLPNGQAESVRIASSFLTDNESFMVWNGDSHLRPGWENGLELSANFILLSPLSGSHWSFATVDHGVVTETAEKVRISDFASLGLYGFASKREFLRALSFWRAEGETFVAPLYNSIIQEGSVVRPAFVDSSYFIPLGTPSEVMQAADFLNVSLPVELLASKP